MSNLFHIATAADWTAAMATGSYAPASLQSEGFVHLSHAHQVAGTLERFYRDVSDLVVVEFDPDRLGAPVVEEDTHGHGQAFPHVYTAIPTAAAVAVHGLHRDPDGQVLFPAGR